MTFTQHITPKHRINNFPDLAKAFTKMKLADDLCDKLSSNTGFAAQSILQAIWDKKLNQVLLMIKDQYKVAPVEMEMLLGRELLGRVLKVE